MSELTDKGNRWVCIVDGHKCHTCYYYGTECQDCLYDKVLYPFRTFSGGIMTFYEYRKHNHHIASTYEEFSTRESCCQDDYSDEEDIDGFRMSKIYN